MKSYLMIVRVRSQLNVEIVVLLWVECIQISNKMECAVLLELSLQMLQSSPKAVTTFSGLESGEKSSLAQDAFCPFHCPLRS